MWIRNGTVYTLHSEIRKAVGQEIGLPAVLTDAILAEHGFFPVVHVEPAETADDESAKEVEPEQVDGVWKRKWLIEKLSAEAFDAKKKEKAKDVRDKRDRLLADCDWTQLLDAPAETQALFAPYRQLLRDVPKQADFPFRIDWPVKP